MPETKENAFVYVCLFNRLWDCPEEGSFSSGLGDIMSIVACELRVECESNAIPVHPITAGSAKLPDWVIREAEETFESNIRKAIRNGYLMQRVNSQISLYPPHENKKLISEVRNREGTKDGTNKMRDMSIRPN